MRVAGASRRHFPQNPHRETFDRVEGLTIVTRSVGRERGQPEGDLGGLFRELIHLTVHRTARAVTRPIVTSRNALV